MITWTYDGDEINMGYVGSIWHTASVGDSQFPGSAVNAGKLALARIYQKGKLAR